MNVLMVGVGGDSWQARGKQLGSAIGARMTTAPTPDDYRWSDVIVLVKRAIEQWAVPVNLQKIIVWDALDFWRQPDQNGQPVSAWVPEVRGYKRLSLVIGATRAMADDLNGIYLSHHSRPGLIQAPPRQEFKVIAYEGTPKYLGRWRKALESACARLGLTFVVNPTDLRDADLLVAFRDGKWDGDVCRRWKSGVKYVNAIAAGRPILTHAHAAFDEIQPEGRLLDDPSELEAAIETYRPYEVRKDAYEQMAHRAQEFSLSAVAHRYHGILTRAWKQAA